MHIIPIYSLETRDSAILQKKKYSSEVSALIKCKIWGKQGHFSTWRNILGTTSMCLCSSYCYLSFACWAFPISMASGCRDSLQIAHFCAPKHSVCSEGSVVDISPFLRHPLDPAVLPLPALRSCCLAGLASARVSEGAPSLLPSCCCSSSVQKASTASSASRSGGKACSCLPPSTKLTSHSQSSSAPLPAFCSAGQSLAQ